MTENEEKAIKWIKNVMNDAVVTLDHIAKKEPNVSPMLYAGRKEKSETILNMVSELKQYRSIGTLKECREATDKQDARKPITHSNTNIADCPCCGATVRGIKNPFGDWCSNCGQKLDWGYEE